MRTSAWFCWIALGIVVGEAFIQPTRRVSDLNGDGKVDLADYAIFQRDFDQPAEATPSPTPSPIQTPPPTTASSQTPICNWLTVPGSPAGLVEVIAFSRLGIWGVVFEASGQPIIVRGTGPVYGATMPGGTVTATVIGMDGGTCKLTLQVGSGGPRLIRGVTNPTIGSGDVWVDKCTFTSTPQTGSCRLWMTNCTVTGASRGVGPCPDVQMVRGCVFKNLSDDGVQNCGLVVDVRIEGIDPGTSGIHADALQGWGRTYGGWIWYNVIAEKLEYQGIFIRSMGKTRGMAMVKCKMTMDGPLTISGASGNALTGEWDHLLIRDCVFTGTNPRDLNVSSDFNIWSEGGKFSMVNSEVSGCTFASWSIRQNIKDAIPAGTFKANKWGNSQERDGIP